MCNVEIVINGEVFPLPGEFKHGILFMNTNKSERNIRKMIAEKRLECIPYGIAIGHDTVICKGPDRDIDREAVNLLISFLLDGKYETVVVDRLTDITPELSDLEEFLKDAAKIGVSVFEIDSCAVRNHVYLEGCQNCCDDSNVLRM